MEGSIKINHVDYVKKDKKVVVINVNFIVKIIIHYNDKQITINKIDIVNFIEHVNLKLKRVVHYVVNEGHNF